MAKKSEEIGLPFIIPEFEEKWEEWLQYRRQRKLPNYVPLGLKKTFTKLVRDSGNNVTIAIAMLEQSMEMNYQGIFPLKNNSNGIGQGTTASGRAAKPGTSEARIARAKDW